MSLIEQGHRVADVVGIDFGTSYTSISVAVDDHVCVLPDDHGYRLHPSVVFYPDGGPPTAGWRARPGLATAARRTIGSPKRLLGRRFSDPALAGTLQAVAYETREGPNDSILVDIHGTEYAIPQVCGEVIGHIREIGERRIGAPIRKAVISIPITYMGTERAALCRAAELAGIEVVATIEEPVAAAMSYGFGQAKEEIVAVYDFGGGTFDFTVIDISGYSFEILARGGDSWLGGDDFDLLLASSVADALWRAMQVELRHRAVEWKRLLFACEAAKRELSKETVAHIVVDNLIEQPRQMNLRQRLDRQTFEHLCGELFDRSINICASALGRAALDPEDIAQVVISGGVSHIPFIRAGINRFFKRFIAPTVNPDEAICAGAGLRAAQLAHHPVRGVGTLDLG